MKAPFIKGGKGDLKLAFIVMASGLNKLFFLLRRNLGVFTKTATISYAREK